MSRDLGQNEREYFLALNLARITNNRFYKLVKHFGDLKNIWEADFFSLKDALGNEKVAQSILEKKKNVNLEKELEKLDQEKINFITIYDDFYPNNLKEIKDPPYLLYYRGKIKKNDPGVAMVGSRKYTSYGKRAALDISYSLASGGINIISGLALGIDSFSHEGALSANGRTIAVLGSGIDKASLYPAANRVLANKIVENAGAVISEYPIGQEALAYNFPARNRIIAGLSLATVVVEASFSSGSLITADFAKKMNRPVFALSGNIYSATGAGTNQLIKDGARLITSASDILQHLNISQKEKEQKIKESIPEDKEELEIKKILEAEPLHIDNIIRLTKFSPGKISSLLIIMEMKGIVKVLGGGVYAISN